MDFDGTRHWHVTLTLAGEPVEPVMLRAALLRLVEERPFLDAVHFGRDSVELKFWDEGVAMLDVASLALRVWDEHRESARLPRWEVVGLEIVERGVQELRQGQVVRGKRTLVPLSF